MPTFKRCDASVQEMADALIAEFETHKPLADYKVKIDFLFAWPDYDETTGEPINDALKKNGVKALGVTRKINLADRAKGNGDAEIKLDGPHWDESDERNRRALLDHELYHIVATEKKDDIGRPIIKLRKHDVDVGWFAIIAKRHGIASIERQQAAQIMEQAGQYFWPELIQATDGRFGKLEARTKG